MKKVLLVLSVILLTACNKPANGSETLQFKEEYEALNKKGIEVQIDESVTIEYLETKEVIDLLENKTGIIYFGFPNCPWCRNIVPILLDIAKNNNEKVYYFNPSSLRGTDDEDFGKIMTVLNDYLQSDEDGEKKLYVPDVYFVKDGNIVGHHLGSASTQTNPYERLTEEQKQELINIYQDLITKMKED